MSILLPDKFIIDAIAGNTARTATSNNDWSASCFAHNTTLQFDIQIFHKSTHSEICDSGGINIRNLYTYRNIMIDVNRRTDVVFQNCIFDFSNLFVSSIETDKQRAFEYIRGYYPAKFNGGNGFVNNIFIDTIFIFPMLLITSDEYRETL